MVFLVYVPVFIGFGCFFGISGNLAFKSFSTTILREIAMVTAGDVGIANFLEKMDQPNQTSTSIFGSRTSDGELIKITFPCIFPRVESRLSGPKNVESFFGQTYVLNFFLSSLAQVLPQTLA